MQSTSTAQGDNPSSNVPSPLDTLDTLVSIRWGEPRELISVAALELPFFLKEKIFMWESYVSALGSHSD